MSGASARYSTFSFASLIACEMALEAGARICHVVFTRVRFGQRDEVLHGFHREARVQHEEVLRDRVQRDRLKVVDRIVVELLVTFARARQPVLNGMEE